MSKQIGVFNNLDGASSKKNYFKLFRCRDECDQIPSPSPNGGRCSKDKQDQHVSEKYIVHQTGLFAFRACLGIDPQREHFALLITICWYPKTLA